MKWCFLLRLTRNLSIGFCMSYKRSLFCLMKGFLFFSPHGPVSAEGLPIRRRDLNSNKKSAVPPSAELCMTPSKREPIDAPALLRLHYYVTDEAHALEMLHVAPAHLRGHVLVCVCGTADGNLYDF